MSAITRDGVRAWQDWTAGMPPSPAHVVRALRQLEHAAKGVKDPHLARGYRSLAAATRGVDPAAVERADTLARAQARQLERAARERSQGPHQQPPSRGLGISQ